MPKPFLIDKDSELESEIIATLLAGLKEWRSDLNYPESHSDMQACVRNMFRLYEIKRRVFPAKLRIKCSYCDGLGKFLRVENNCRYETYCEKCNRKGYIEE